MEQVDLFLDREGSGKSFAGFFYHDGLAEGCRGRGGYRLVGIRLVFMNKTQVHAKEEHIEP